METSVVVASQVEDVDSIAQFVISPSQPDPQLSDHLPTEEQLNIGFQNLQTVFNPSGKTTVIDFNAIIDLPEFPYQQIVLNTFFLNTYQLFFEDCDDSVNGAISEVCRVYIEQQANTPEWLNLSRRVFDMICYPLPLKENPAFYQCWNDMLETSFQWGFEQLQCQVYNHRPDEFPFNIRVD